MAIEKRIAIDIIKIFGDFRAISTRIKLEIVEDGVVIGDFPASLSTKLPDEDITDHPDITVGKQKMPVPQAVKDELQLISTQVWTAAVKTKYEAEKPQVEKAK